MYEHYWVVDEFGDIVGDAWRDTRQRCYVVAVTSLGENLTFANFDKMVRHLWGLGLDTEGTLPPPGPQTFLKKPIDILFIW